VAVGGWLLLLVLIFWVGFVSGALWQRSRPEVRPGKPATEARPARSTTFLVAPLATGRG
jgi:uncharacterized iron-regulated membrane protein